MRLRNKTFSLNFLLLSQLTDVLAFPSINSLLHFPYVLKHFTCKFVAIIVFKLVLRSNFCALEIKSSCLFSINFRCTLALALKRRVTKFEHVIIFLFRSWCILPINILDYYFSEIEFINLLIMILKVNDIVE